jgi:hypothetical protein
LRPNEIFLNHLSFVISQGFSNRSQSANVVDQADAHMRACPASVTRSAIPKTKHPAQHDTRQGARVEAPCLDRERLSRGKLRILVEKAYFPLRLPMNLLRMDFEAVEIWELPAALKFRHARLQPRHKQERPSRMRR